MGIEGVMVPIDIDNWKKGGSKYHLNGKGKSGSSSKSSGGSSGDRRFSTSGGARGEELSGTKVSRGSRETLLGN